MSFAAGNATIWKPSHTTPLCAIAITKIVSKVLEKNGIPGAVAGLVVGDKDTGVQLVDSPDVELGEPKSNQERPFEVIFYSVSFTGSEYAGGLVGKLVAARFGKAILELGGNNGNHPCVLRNRFIEHSSPLSFYCDG